MLADDVLAARGGMADRFLQGGVTNLAAAIGKAARFDLTPGVMLSAHAVHNSAQASREQALPLCRLPFEYCWFEWLGHNPANHEEHSVVGPSRIAPVPRRCGCLVQTDASRQRGVVTWAWFTKEMNQGVNMCPLGITFDWREEAEPVEDLVQEALTKANAPRERLMQEAHTDTYQKYPKMRGFSRDQLTAMRNRFGIVWSPFVRRFAENYERGAGPIHPGHALWQHAEGDITGEPGMLQSVILLLNSRNMTAAEAVPAPVKLNKQRARNNKPPLMDYTTIRIKLSRTLHARAGAAGERAPARLHVVAGHFKIRKTGIYWWNNFTRGNATQGVVRQQTRKVVV
jgi:hypothetical protein